MTTTRPTYPDVFVQLTGEDGNAFAIIGRVAGALRAAGYRDEARTFQAEAMEQGSYDELLQFVLRTVEVG